MYSDYRLAEINEWRRILNLRYERKALLNIKLRNYQFVIAGVLFEHIDSDSYLVRLTSDADDKVTVYVFALSDIVNVAEEFSD